MPIVNVIYQTNNIVVKQPSTTTLVMPITGVSGGGGGISALSDAVTPASGSEMSIIASSAGVLKKLLGGTGVTLTYNAGTGDVTVACGAPDTLPAPTDITTNNATTSAHGLMPKGTGSTSTFYRSDVTQAALPSNTTGQAGTVSTAPNDIAKVWRGDATWNYLGLSSETNGSFTIPAAGSTVTVTLVSTTWTAVGQTIAIWDGTSILLGEITTRTSNTSVVVTNRGYQGFATSGTMATAAWVKFIAPSFATSTQPGFVPAPPNSTTQFFRGDASFATPPNATATTAGYVPAPPNNTTTFLRGDATFATPPSATATVAGYVPTPPNNTTTFLRGDATFATPPSATATVAGYVPTPPNNTTTFLRGDATFSAVGYGSLTGNPSVEPNTKTTALFTIPSSGSAVTLAITSASWPTVGQVVEINDGTNYGFFEITTVTSATSIAVTNRGYNGNPTSGTMASGAAVILAHAGQATATQSGLIPAPPNNTTTFLRGDATFSTPPSATATTAGYVPTPPNNTTTFLRGDATFASVPSSPTPNTTTTASFTIPAAGSAVTLAITAATWPIVGQVVEINDGTNYGFFEITTVTSSTSIAVTNRGYNGNPVSGTMGSGAVVVLSSAGQATATKPGFIPAPPNSTSQYLRGDATFSAIQSAAGGTLGIIPSTDVQIFTTTGAFTWTKPTVGTPQWVEIACQGAGLGGGSGGYAAAATAVGGGGGASGGSWSTVKVPASVLGATVPGSVGAGGLGGTAVTTSGNAGNNGAAYSAATNDSWFGTNSVTGSNICQARGGNPGNGGPLSTSGGAGGATTGAPGLFSGAAGGAGSANGAAATTGAGQAIAATSGAGGGGGGGGGFSTGNVEVAGAAGSAYPAWVNNALGKGAAGAVHAAGGAGGNAPSSSYLPGGGGGGGGASNTAATAGGQGGAGGLYGGGGGGGGAGDASANAIGSGAGGAGAPGFVIVTTYF